MHSSQAILCTAVFGFFGTWGIHTCKHIEHRAMAEHSLCWDVAGVLATSIRLAIHYMAMLFAMTYQVGIFIAICMGGGLGFLLIKNCHIECLKCDTAKDVMVKPRAQELAVVADPVENSDTACC
jgi:hypothetical protein